ncbi:hypothetical protein [Ammoniphilus sp. YIM 78166]|uniref:hypothetical protein n=1 Tax=Ammoniphilus sp. YIM 78166 TaxID=1644106 RepID=UPI00106F24D5|nr:hypothetical protein [Ammoniphilus sp. YIM 78166]
MKVPLSKQTVGCILDEPRFSDLYFLIREEGQLYFSREDSLGKMDIIIVFDNIDDFTESSGSNILLECKTYKDRMIFVVWTLTDPENPLGFPIAFSMTDRVEREQFRRLIEQEQVWIHYLAIEEESLIHIFSEAYTLPQQEKEEWFQQVKALMDHNSSEQSKDDQEEPLIRSAMGVSEKLLLQEGIGYALDFTSLVNKYGVQQAEERLLESLLHALSSIKNHPSSGVRESTFLLWVEEKREWGKDGKEARLLTVYMSPPLTELLAVVHDQQMEENPISTALLSMPEFLVTVQGRPIEEGAFPIMEYNRGEVIHLELDEEFQERLSKLYDGPGEKNPYIGGKKSGEAETNNH